LEIFFIAVARADNLTTKFHQVEENNSDCRKEAAAKSKSKTTIMISNAE
jgi:hypothetical protein